MKKKVLIIDTSILCVWLQVTDMENCGPDNDRWTYERVCRKIAEEQEKDTTFILPVATIIETGNHIAHARGDRFNPARKLADKIIDAANANSPWAAFTEQEELWNNQGLASLAARWKDTAVNGQSLGDASIVDVANYYYEMGFEVEILTGDKGLKAYQPSTTAPARIPRRYKK